MRAVVNKLDSFGRALKLPAAKQHLDVTHEDDDTRIGELIDAATEYVGNITQSPITVTRYQMSLSQFLPSIELPAWPLHVETGVTVEYHPQAGGALTAADVYDVIAHDSTPSELVCKPNTTFPSVANLTFPVIVKWSAGFEANKIPASFIHAIKLLVRHWYDETSPVVVGTITSDVSRSLSSILKSLKPGGVSGAPPQGVM